ncbi:MAG: excinuclease ABC subunit UvrA [Hyphomonadaceae bacterium]|nr:excinuclease ABC subunit UvrA [Hyphomonadaceae bacterium]MBC6412622.1 excinuclease ABC subunit UvrA [Hyphomonadaceae bacterium]
MSNDPKSICVRGAREHNLRNVNVDLPRDKLIVITGLSGSGKSSLAFDTIYAEGQRRYVESLSAYARQFLELQQKPDVDSIEGLSPAISIEQKTTSRNPRSTVGTVTEIHDYMRLLWARVGVPYSPATGLPIESQTVSQMVDIVMAMPEGTRLYVLAPIVRGRKGEYRREFANLMKQGFQRAKIDGEFYRIEETPELDKKYKHDIDVVVDRVAVRKGVETRLADSIETALRLADGVAVAEKANDGERTLFSEKFACPVSGFTLPEIEPRLFSFNNPFGACPSCDGLGRELKFDADLVIPDDEKTLADGAIVPWSKTPGSLYTQTLKALGKHYGFSLDKQWKYLGEEARDVVLYGTRGRKIRFVYKDDGRRYETIKPFEGVIPNLERRYRDTESTWMREQLGRYMSDTDCQACGGKRLRPEALCVKVADMDISVTGEMSIRDASAHFRQLFHKLAPQQLEIAERILKEINERLQFLNAVGLDYLTLGRGSGSLSGGESQRIRLASQIGSGLTGVLYVLDEPSIGLHQRDNARLMKTLKNLRDLGNTVIVVEHDEDAILTADHVIDMGPKAGIDGGQVVAEGSPAKIKKSEKSITGQYLSGKKQIDLPEKRREVGKNKLRITGASGNNLKGVTAEFPLGLFICVTGVSGGGKSTLTIETLYKTAARKLNRASAPPMLHDAAEGFEHLDKVIDIDQSPIGRTPRSNPATYTGAFTPIRDWYAGLPEAKARGYKPGRFSFNVKGGRCEACQGAGVIKIEMHFLPDVYVTCDQCRGKRYNRETLEIRFREQSVSDVLNMTVDEAAEFFKAVPSIRDKMITLQRVGLGYLKVGQQATTLSGGEAQRVKLARELAKRATGRTLYILDEPTTGLHFADVAKLLDVLQELVKNGNTMVVIEHNLDVIKTADWLIDLGPEGGDSGGEIVTVGTPEDVAEIEQSWTGRFLKPILERDRERARQDSPDQR